MRKYLPGFLIALATSGILLTGCVTHDAAVISSNPGPVLVAPPQPPTETRGPSPSQEHVWVEGYWVYINNRYVWIPGQWEIRPRPEAVWVPGYWNQRGNAWYWTPGRWQ